MLTYSTGSLSESRCEFERSSTVARLAAIATDTRGELGDTRLVAAGVILGRDQDQTRACWLGGLGWTTEAVQDAEDYGVRGQNSKSNRGDYRKENNQRH